MQIKFAIIGVIVGVGLAYFRTKSASPTQNSPITQRSYAGGQGYGS